MRIGKPIQRSRKTKNANQRRPRSDPPSLSIGPVSPDLIASVLAPKLIRLASESLERYAHETVLYEEALALLNSSSSINETEVGADGSSLATSSSTPDLSLPKAPFFDTQSRIDEFQFLLSETSDHFMSKAYTVNVKAAKFERLLDEKYGRLRPFIKAHPEVEQLLRSVQRKYATGYFSPLRSGPPPIPRSTSVILLFMLYRGKVPFQVVVLAAVFLLVGLQPWALVAMVAFLQLLFHRRKGRVVGPMPRKIPSVPPYYRTAATDAEKHALLRTPVGQPLEDETNGDFDGNAYDVLMIGQGPETLYTASLLSRSGRRVLVLCPSTDASGCLQFQNAPAEGGAGIRSDVWQQLPELSFDVRVDNIAKISRQQELLAPALATSTDCQGGIRFAKIGSAADGYAFEILSVPGMGASEVEHGGSAGDIPLVLCATNGWRTLMTDAAEYFGDQWPEVEHNESLTGQYIATCQTMNASAGRFYLSKLLSESTNKYLGAGNAYADAAIRTLGAFLNHNFPLNPHLRSLMAAIGMKAENITPNNTSMAAHVTNICNAVSEEGMHYPVGGPRALCHAFANIIEQSGGRIVTSAPVAELLFDESIPVKKHKSKKNVEPNPPFCVGVKLRTGSKEVRFAADRYQSSPRRDPAVVSMEGFIQTFIRYLPDDIRTQYKVPRGVPALSERRPVIHFLFALNGSAAELNVTGADFYRLPGAAVAPDTVDPTTGEVQYGTIGWIDDDPSGGDSPEESAGTESTTKAENDDAANRTREGRKKKKKQNKFETGQSWIRISFPSAKDPSFATRHGNVTTCVVTIEADDDFVQLYDTKPKIFMLKKPTAASTGDIQRLTERVKRDLFDIYPQLTGMLTLVCVGACWNGLSCISRCPLLISSDKVLHSEISGPFQKGLSHNPERYIAKGIRCDTPYPSLFVGGSDLTIGDSFSASVVGGWLVANAICGYTTFDHLFLQKNITADLQRFLEPPTLRDDTDDVAVPYVAPSDGSSEETVTDDGDCI
jgi:hypothetical protein